MTTPRIVRRLVVSALCISGGAWTLFAQAPAGQTPAAADRAVQNRATQSQEAAMTPQQFAQRAALSGLKEVSIARMAVTKAQNTQVRQFANTLLRDHTKANQELSRIATQKGFSLPAANTFDSEARALSRVPGARDPADTTAKSEEPKDIAKDDTAATDTDRQQVRDVQTDAQVKEKYSQTIQRLQGLSGAEFDREYIKQMVEDHEKGVQKFEMASKSLQDEELKRFATDTLPTLRSHHEQAQKLAATVGAGAGAGAEKTAP
jgi:putative membrane protein